MHKKFKIKPAEPVNLNHLETKGSHHFFANEEEAKKLLAEDEKKGSSSAKALCSRAQSYSYYFPGDGYRRNTDKSSQIKPKTNQLFITSFSQTAIITTMLKAYF